MVVLAAVGSSEWVGVGGHVECVPKAHSLTSKLSVMLNRFHESYEKKGVCVSVCDFKTGESEESPSSPWLSPQLPTRAEELATQPRPSSN